MLGCDFSSEDKTAFLDSETTLVDHWCLRSQLTIAVSPFDLTSLTLVSLMHCAASRDEKLLHFNLIPSLFSAFCVMYRYLPHKFLCLSPTALIPSFLPSLPKSMTWKDQK